MLIKLWDKLTHLNIMITLEAIDKLEDKLGGIFTMAKTYHYTQGQKYATWQVQSLKASTSLSLAMPPGPTRYPPT